MREVPAPYLERIILVTRVIPGAKGGEGGWGPSWWGRQEESSH